MGWEKGKPRKPRVESPDAGEVQEATQEVAHQQEVAADNLATTAFAGIEHSGDPEDKTLVAAYAGELTSYQWEDANPIQVPEDIRKANPGMRFRYRALDPGTGGLRKGDNYQGWQVYTSTKYPDGKKFGGDLVLAFMPEERAEARNRYYQEQSTRSVKDIQLAQIEAMDRASAEMAAKGESVKFTEGAGSMVVGARRFPDRAKGGAVTEQHRGYKPEEVRELMQRAADDRAKNRAYSVPGQASKRGSVQR